MAEKSKKVEEYRPCSRCRGKCRGAGSGFVAICKNRGRASGQEVKEFYLCAECMSKFEDEVDGFLHPGLPTKKERALMAEYEAAIVKPKVGEEILLET